MPPLRVGVLGAARITPKALIVPARQGTEVEIVAVAARDQSRAMEFANKYGIPRVHANYETLLIDDEIDAVYNPLPNGLHGQWTIAALEAGKHVLCEKPFTANASESRAVANAAERSGKVLMQALHYRYHPLFERVLELVRMVGPIRDVSARMIAVIPNRNDVRYDLNLAGGATMDVGCYAIHQIRTVTAAEPAVVHAHARLARSGVDRSMTAEFALANGGRASMDVALLTARLPIADLRVTGNAGQVAVHFPTRPELAWVTSRTGGRTRRERLRGESTFWYQLQAFCGAVQHGEPVLTGPADAVATMQLIDDVYQAAGLTPRQPAH